VSENNQKPELWRLEEVCVREDPDSGDVRMLANFSADPFTTNASIEIELIGEILELWLSLELKLREVVYRYMRKRSWPDNPEVMHIGAETLAINPERGSNDVSLDR
jgi:hypothetical protein